MRKAAFFLLYKLSVNERRLPFELNWHPIMARLNSDDRVIKRMALELTSVKSFCCPWPYSFPSMCYLRSRAMNAVFYPFYGLY